MQNHQVTKSKAYLQRREKFYEKTKIHKHMKIWVGNDNKTVLLMPFINDKMENIYVGDEQYFFENGKFVDEITPHQEQMLIDCIIENYIEIMKETDAKELILNEVDMLMGL